VVHSTALNSSDNLHSYPPDNHHSSDDVYWRGGGTNRLSDYQANRLGLGLGVQYSPLVRCIIKCKLLKTAEKFVASRFIQWRDPKLTIRLQVTFFLPFRIQSPLLNWRLELLAAESDYHVRIIGTCTVQTYVNIIYFNICSTSYQIIF